MDQTPVQAARASAEASGRGSPSRTERWADRTLGILGIHRTDDAVTVRVSVKRWGYAVAAAALLYYVCLFVQALIQFPYYSGASTVDEQLLYYQTARNYNRYGFMSTKFLQDFSTSSKPEEHPVVYNHMPAGPEIFVALVWRAFGEDFRILRAILAIFFLGGIVCYFKFAESLLSRAGLAGAGFGVLFIVPYAFVHSMDHPMYALFPFFAFFPLVAAEAFDRTGKRVWIFLACVAVLIASLHQAYQHQLMMLISWVGISLLGLYPLRRRHAVLFAGMLGLGFLIHLAQNYWYLGPDQFYHELAVTISNRFSGHPSADELLGYYRSLDMVHHGTHTLDFHRLLFSVNAALAFPGRPFFLGLGAFVVIRELVRTASFDAVRSVLSIPRAPNGASPTPALNLLGRLAFWAVPASAIPLLVLPAYSADYGTHGLDQFYLSSLAIAIVGMMLREVNFRPAPSSEAPEGSRKDPWWRLRFSAMADLGLWVALVPVLALGLYAAGKTQFSNLRETGKAMGSNKYASLTYFEKELEGKVVMTNVYPVVPGFFTREAALGGAEAPVFEAVGEPDVSKCFAPQVRGFGRTSHPKPTHYVLFRDLFTGFTRDRDLDSLNHLKCRLAERYPIVRENDLFTVFDLQGTVPNERNDARSH